MDDETALIPAGTAPPSPVDAAIAAWLHAKRQRSQSAKTLALYSATIWDFRERLLARGLDLDAADPRRARQDLARHDATPEMLEDHVAERLTLLALAAQSFAAEPAETRYGPRTVAPATANLRLAALASFYTYALHQGLLHGENPIQRVERRKVQAYAHARPLPYAELAEQLNAIDLATPAGLRDYALLVLGLHTGRRLSELATMQRQDLVVRKTHLAITLAALQRRQSDVRRSAAGRAAGIGGASGAGLATLPDGSASGFECPRHHPAYPQRAGMDQPGAQRHIWTIPFHPWHRHDSAEQRLGTSKVHALRHTFARALEDAGAKVSEIQARLGHTSLETTGRYLARLHDGENPHLSSMAALYGLRDRVGQSDAGE